MSTHNYTSSGSDTQVSVHAGPATAHLTRECDPLAGGVHGGCAANPAEGECCAADWSPADLAVVVREYLDLPVAVEDLERVGINPALRGLLNAVRANPGSDRVVRDWAANLLPHLRDAFARPGATRSPRPGTPLHATAKMGRQTVTGRLAGTPANTGPGRPERPKKRPKGPKARPRRGRSPTGWSRDR